MTISRWISTLNLRPHPEGGAYCRIFTSEQKVTRQSDGAERLGLTQIYYALGKSEVSRWHVVGSDETWTLVEGGPLCLLTWEKGKKEIQQHILDRSKGRYSMGVPAGIWQAAFPLGNNCLCVCSVGPGFDFADHQLVDAVPEVNKLLSEIGKEWPRLL